MQKVVAAVLLPLGIVLAASAICAAQQPAYRPGELLVRMKATAGAGAVSRAASSMGARALNAFDHGRVQHLRLPSEMGVEDAMAILQADPDVEFVEPNYLLYPQSLPDDPYFNRQWGLDNTGQAVSGFLGTAGADIDAVRAWDLLKGSGATTVVAVVDTGSNMSHPDLAGKVWTNPGEIAQNGIDDDHNGFVDDIHGWDFADGDNNPQDASGHGTHVAGIIAAQNDNGVGVAGTGWAVTIMPVRFMNAFDSGSVADAIRAIEYAVAQGVRIINCSWGSSGYSTSLYGVMASSNALFVCAAGNNGTDNDRGGFYPASYQLANIISVAAGDQMDDLTWFSNYGRQSVHLAAPGVRIYSLGLDRRTLWSEDFHNGNLQGWQTGGQPDEWTIGTTAYGTGSEVLRMTSQSSYANGADTWVVSPALDLRASAGCKLSFDLIGATEANRDMLYVEVSTDASTWTNRAIKVLGSVAYNGLSGSYPYRTTATLDLGPWDGRASFYFRFRFISNAQNEQSGYSIDNITLSSTSSVETYQYMSGTSMAAGFVSGVAAALLSKNSDLTPVALKSLMMDGVDLNANFTDTTVSGGRLNAYSSLMLLDDPHYQIPDSPASAGAGSGGGGGGCFIASLF